MIQISELLKKLYNKNKDDENSVLENLLPFIILFGDKTMINIFNEYNITKLTDWGSEVEPHSNNVVINTLEGFEVYEYEIDLFNVVTNLTLNTFHNTLTIEKNCEFSTEMITYDRKLNKKVIRSYYYEEPEVLISPDNSCYTEQGKLRRVLSVIKSMENLSDPIMYILRLEDENTKFLPILETIDNSELTKLPHTILLNVNILRDKILLEQLSTNYNITIKMKKSQVSIENINNIINYTNNLYNEYNKLTKITIDTISNYMKLESNYDLVYVTEYGNIEDDIDELLNDDSKNIVYNITRKTRISKRDDHVYINGKEYDNITYETIIKCGNLLIERDGEFILLLKDDKYYIPIKIKKSTGKLIKEILEDNTCSSLLYSSRGIFLIGCQNDIISKFSDKISKYVSLRTETQSIFINNNNNIVVFGK